MKKLYTWINKSLLSISWVKNLLLSLIILILRTVHKSTTVEIGSLTKII